MPVLAFLGTLLYLDGYKLVKLRVVVAIVCCGAMIAGASYLANAAVLRVVDIDLIHFSRYIAPFIEEFLKGMVIVVLIYNHRIGFSADAAIFGFSVGTGFALVENVYLLGLIPNADLGIWIVRGFGTAILHGSATAIFGVMGLFMLDKAKRGALRALLPGFGIAVLLHAGYNHLSYAPAIGALAVLLIMPCALLAVFEHSERAVSEWLGKGFDVDMEMLGLINSGRLAGSPVGQYLHTLRDKFPAPVVADIVCYLRLYIELSLCAKGVLLMREVGYDVPIDESTKAKFVEMGHIEYGIGKVGLIAIRPMLRMNRKDLWQFYMLGR